MGSTQIECSLELKAPLSEKVGLKARLLETIALLLELKLGSIRVDVLELKSPSLQREVPNAPLLDMLEPQSVLKAPLLEPKLALLLDREAPLFEPKLALL